MPRRVEDIVRTDHRSIRDTAEEREEAAARRKKMAPANPERVREVPIHKLKIAPPIHVGKTGRSFSDPAQRKTRSNRTWWTVTILLVVAGVAGAGYFASIHFSRATFTIVPVSIPIPVDTTIVATATGTPGYLAYRLAPFTGSTQAVVPATTGALTSTRASGSVTLYNSYAKESQRLTAGTRISPDGKLIYKLTGSVVVPGYTVNSQDVTVPGALTVPVIADLPGAEYNMPKAGSTAIFKIVAYQGGPRYAAFSGRLASDLAGGFSGQKKNVDKTVLASTTESLRAALTAQLIAKAKAAVPDGYIMYDGAYKASFGTAALSGTTTNSATVTLNGTLYSVLFKATDIAVKLAGADTVGSFNSFPYRAPGLESLSFTITNLNDFSPASQNTLIARVKGDMKLVGTIPVDTLKDKLAGLSLQQTSAILKAYSAVIDINKSSGELFPSWSMSVPSDKARISIEVEDK